MEAPEKQKADQVYARFREKLEAEHFGKIVAIDTDLGEIVGIGDAVLDAYNKAKEKTSKTRFAFRRVGFPYIDRLYKYRGSHVKKEEGWANEE